MDPIVPFVKDRSLVDCNEVRKLKHQAPRYVVHNGKLYKRSCSLSLLQCLHLSETDYAL